MAAQKTEDLGQVYTFYNGQLVSYYVRFLHLEPDSGDIFGKFPFHYLFSPHSDYERSDNEILLKVHEVVLSIAKSDEKKAHSIAIRFVLDEIKNNSKEKDFVLKNNMLNIISSDNNNLKNDILRFIYDINEKQPGFWISKHDLDFNFFAKQDLIYSWAEVLVKRGLLEKKLLESKSRINFQQGKLLEFYRLKQENIFKIKSELNNNLDDYTHQELTLENLEEYLINDENDIFEMKGSFSIDLDRFYKGDKTINKKKELEEEVLESIIAFLNSAKSKTKYVLIGLLEHSKFKNVSDLKNICKKLLCGINIEYTKNGWDNYQLKLWERINNRINANATNYIKIGRITIAAKDVCIIQIHWQNGKPDKWFYLDNKDFFIRQGNRTLRLTGNSADDYKRTQPWRK